MQHQNQRRQIPINFLSFHPKKKNTANAAHTKSSQKPHPPTFKNQPLSHFFK
ncbi:hypothetical Protein pso3_07970 [Candidatus Phytoplasma solani]